jgi:hypothetical protein
MASKKNRSRKSLAVALAIVGVAGLSMASAAQLTVTSSPVIAGVSLDSACDTSVLVAYGTVFGTNAYNVHSVTISDINITPVTGCLGKTIDFTLLNAGGTAIANGTGTLTPIALASQTIVLTTDVSAAAVAQIAVVIR